MNRFVSVVSFGTASVTFLVANLAAALPILLDQEFVPFDPSLQANIGVNNEVDHAQTFTVGLGGRLMSAEVLVTKYSYVTEPLLFDLRTVIGGGLPSEPDAGPNILASLSIDASAVPTYDDSNSPWPSLVTIDLGSFGIAVSPGQQLALAFRSDDPGGPNQSKWGYTWRGEVGGDYDGGNAFPRGGTGGWQDYLNGRYDLAFRTFVAVPEPAAITIVASSLFAVSLIRRRNCPFLPPPSAQRTDLFVHRSTRPAIIGSPNLQRILAGEIDGSQASLDGRSTLFDVGNIRLCNADYDSVLN